ncbi:43062_t:CDS:2, partial [Gigaspora margarita]
MIRRGQVLVLRQCEPCLAHKAREHPWCRIILCTEEYTKLDRDINGARNILLRYLTKK